MNPQCARCGKVVYPTEKVNCLDKVLGRGRARTTPPECAPTAPLPPQLRRGGQGRAGPVAEEGELAGGERSASGAVAEPASPPPGDSRPVTALAQG